MKFSVILLLSLLLCGAAAAQIHVIVEPADSVKVVKPIVLDSTAAAEATKLYTMLQSTEWNMRNLQGRLSSDIPDANREDKVRQQISGALIEEQIALWDFQIERAAGKRDKSLLKAFQTGFTALSSGKSPLQQGAKQELKKIEKLLEEK